MPLTVNNSSFKDTKLTIDKNIMYVKCSFDDCVLTMTSNDWLKQFQDCYMENVTVINTDGNMFVGCKMEGNKRVEEEVSAWSVNGDIKPDEGVRVLIKHESGNVEVAIYLSYSKVWIYSDTNYPDDYSDNVVTHWMYIPT